MKLVIKFPTRNRPEKFRKVFDLYKEYLSGVHDVHFIISMDEDDETMNNEEIIEYLEKSSGSVCKIDYYYGKSKSKIEAVNADMDGVDGDVLLVASDDMIPVQKGYDKVIYDAFSQVFPDYDGAIKFWDGRRPKNDPLMTLPVLGFPYYRRFGYIYHPDYTSVYSDNEQTLVAARLNKLALTDRCIIRHAWTPHPFDELHARNENREMYKKDKAVFDRRLKNNFDLGVCNTL